MSEIKSEYDEMDDETLKKVVKKGLEDSRTSIERLTKALMLVTIALGFTWIGILSSWGWLG